TSRFATNILIFRCADRRIVVIATFWRAMASEKFLAPLLARFARSRVEYRPTLSPGVPSCGLICVLAQSRSHCSAVLVARTLSPSLNCRAVQRTREQAKLRG